MREFTELGRTTDNLDKVQVFEEAHKMLKKNSGYKTLLSNKIYGFIPKKRVSGLPNIFDPIVFSIVDARFVILIFGLFFETSNFQRKINMVSSWFD